jgi:hypothetical protein
MTTLIAVQPNAMFTIFNGNSEMIVDINLTEEQIRHYYQVGFQITGDDMTSIIEEAKQRGTDLWYSFLGAECNSTSDGALPVARLLKSGGLLSFINEDILSLAIESGFVVGDTQEQRILFDMASDKGAIRAAIDSYLFFAVEKPDENDLFSISQQSVEGINAVIPVLYATQEDAEKAKSKDAEILLVSWFGDKEMQVRRSDKNYWQQTNNWLTAKHRLQA